MNQNEVTGGFQDMTGKVKDAAGGLTGDTGLQAEGKFDQASGTLKSKLGAAADRISDAASGLGQTTRDAAQSARQEAGAMAGKAQEFGVNAGQQVAETVRSQPLLSLLAAAALGYGIAFLLHSPSSPLAPPRPARRFWS